MKQTVFGLLACLFLLTACERVAPNYAGVLMENYGKNGKDDYSIAIGRVSTFSPGTELFQVPLWEQRVNFDKNDPMNLQASDKTAFTCVPSYSYHINKDRAVDVVFNNSHLGSGNDFLVNLQENVLNARIYDVLKDISRKYSTEYLMAEGSSLKFEQEAEAGVRERFDSIGITLETFTAQLNFSDKVTKKIDDRNEVDQEIVTLDKQIAKQKKQNELAELEAQENIIKSKGLTPEVLKHEFIMKWNGSTPLYGNTPVTLFKTVQ